VIGTLEDLSLLVATVIMVLDRMATPTAARRRCVVHATPGKTHGLNLRILMGSSCFRHGDDMIATLWLRYPSGVSGLSVDVAVPVEGTVAVGAFEGYSR